MPVNKTGIYLIINKCLLMAVVGMPSLPPPLITLFSPRLFTLNLLFYAFLQIYEKTITSSVIYACLSIRSDSWLRHCATSRKVAGSIPDGVTGIFSLTSSFRPHYVPGVDSASNRNEYQKYFLQVKAAGE